MWASVGSAAKKWAHNARTVPADWGRKGKVSLRRKKKKRK